MEQETSEVSKIIELKRFEQPDETFFADFLSDFQDRQRREMVNVSARGLLAERLSVFLKQWTSLHWASLGTAAVLVSSVVWAYSGDVVGSLSAQAEKEDLLEKDLPEKEQVKVQFMLSDAAEQNFIFVDLSEEPISQDVEF